MLDQIIPTVEALPGPGVLERIAFEQPWPAVVALLVIGLLAAVMLIRRGRVARAVVIDTAATALAAGLIVSATVVTTDHERVRAGSRGLVAAALAGDESRVGEILAPDARLTAAGASSVGLQRDAVLAAVRALPGRAPTRGHAIVDLTASVDGANAARSRLVVRTDFRGGGPAFSAWQLNWRLDPGGAWRVTRIEALSINGQAPGPWLAGEIASLGR
ncbi:MAG: nuclear transport factor 2 family protein [Planctomycetota bacterium]|nr:MAG: nuclear transport factor 2 family protein [Planctomycetota bacterium]